MITISKYSSTIEYKLKTTLDSSGLTKLQSEIKKVQTELRNLTTYSTSVQLNKPVKEAIKDLDKLQTAIARSYNSKLGMLDTTKLKSNFKDLNLNLSSLQRSFNATGATGQIAFNNLLGRLGNLDTGLKTVSKTTDKVMNTLGNTFRWGIIASGFQSIMNSAHEAVQYVKDLDTSLTNIMMVTDYSKQQMNEYAKSANEAAKALGSTTVAMTDATLVFAQQGFDLNKSDQLAQLSTKLANASQQDTATTSDQITAYMNAYGLDSNIEKLSSALDSWAEVANVSAADVQELAAASQKAASTANTVGVNMDQLAAQIATIESVTREAPENIGNGLKTIYARFSDIAMGETLDDGVDLGTVTGTLEKVGVSVLGSDGKMREVGSIMEDLMKVWSNIDSTQKNAIATTLAGKYQLARFEALMNRSDMYNEYKSASQNADGTLDVMNEKYVNSIEGKMNKLQATFEETLGKFFETDDFYGFIDGLTTAVDLMNQLVDAIGGGKSALIGFGAVAGKVFSTSIGRGINNFISNKQAEKTAKQNAKNAPELLKNLGIDTSQVQNQDILNFVQTGLKRQPKMSEEQANTFNDQKDQLIAARNEQIAAETALQEAIIKTNTAYGEEELITTEINEKTGDLTVNASKLYAQIAEGAGYSKEEVKGMAGSFSSIDNELEKMKQALGLYIEEFEQMPPAANEASIASKKFTQRTNEILAAVDKLPQKSKDIFRDLISQIKEAENNEEVFSQKMIELEREINKVQIALEKGKFLETGTDIDNAVSRVNEANAANAVATENANQTMGTLTTEQRVQDLTNMAVAVGNLAFAWQSFQSLGSIWDNDDLEIGEKILQTIINLSMAIPMATTGIKDLGTGFQTLGQMILDYGKKRLAAKAASTAGAAALTGEAVAAETATVATKGFFATLLAGLGPILAVVAAIAAIGVTIKLIIDKYNEAANAAKEAQNQADQLADVYNNVKTSHQELEQSFDSYEKAKQAMSELTEGTNEWNSKLKETNDQVLELLDKYPELAKYVHRDSNGLLTFDEFGKNEFLAKQEESVNGAKVAATTAQVIANDKQATADKVSLLRQTNTGIQWSESSGFAGSWQELSMNQLNSLYNLIEKEGEQALYDKDKVREVTGASSQLLENIVDSADKIVDLYNKEKTQNQADDIKLQQAMLGELKTQVGFNNLDSETANDVANILSKKALDPNSEGYQNAKESVDNTNWEDRIDEYAAAMGYKVKEKSQDGDSTFTDTEGNEVKVNIEAINDFLIASKAMESAAKEWDSVANKLQAAVNNPNNVLTDNLGSDKTQNLLANFDSENKNIDLSGINETDLRWMKDKANSEEGFSKEELGITDSLATDLGFKDADDYAKSFTEEVKNKLNETFKLEDLLSQDIEPGQYSESQQQEIVNAINSISDLQKATDKGALSQENYSKALINLGSRYEDLQEETDAARKAQQNYDRTVKKYGKTSEQAIKASDELAKSQAKLKTAIVMKQWTQSKDKILGYLKTLEEADSDSTDYINAMQDMTDILSDLTGVDLSNFDMSDFLADPQHLEDIKAALDGDYDAFMRIKQSASEKIQLKAEAKLDDAELWSTVDSIQQYAMSGEFASLEAGANLDDAPFMATLSSMLSAMIATGQDISGITDSLAAIGIEAEVTYKTIDVATEVDGETGIGTAYKTMSVPEIHFKKTGPSNTSYQDYLGGGSGGSGGSSGGSGGSGGGGGGGGGSSYEPKTKDRNDDELDRYKKVDAQLNKIDKTLDKLNTDKERLVGYKWQNAMTKEIKLLYKQIDLQKEKLELQKQEAEEKRNQLANDYGVTFDADGIPQNYKEKFQELQNSLNDAIDAYNNSTTEEDQNYWEDIIEQRQKAFDDFKDLIDKYLDVQIDGIEESEKNIRDFYDKIEDMRIEAFKKQVEATDKIKEVNETLLEFQNTAKWFGSDNPLRDMELSASKLGGYFSNANTSATKYYDDLIKQEQKRWHETDDEQEKENAHARAEFWRKQKSKALNGEFATGGDGTGWLDRQLDSAETIVGEIQKVLNTGKSDIFGENTEALYEMAEDQYKALNQTLQDMESEYNNLHQAINDYIDDMVDKAQDRLDMFDQITDELDHQMNIIEQLYGDKSYDLINKALGVQNQNYSNKINELQQQKAVWEETLKTLEVGSDEWKKVNEQIKDAQSELNSLVESSLENMRKQYENTVNKTLDTWTNNILGGDIDWMADQWELINRNADYYLDDTNKAYNIQKLQSKYLDLLDNASGLDTQYKITEQMNQQLDLLRDKTKLSQYDVEYANAQLEILQKQIALEDAQRNKSQMKLRRDSQGNYSYVYTANEDDVRSAEGDLLDAKNNAYNLSKDNMKQAQDDSLSALQNAKQMLMDIWTDANTTLAEKQERTKWLINNLKEYIKSTGEQLSTSQTNIINDFIGMCDSLTDENRADLEDVYNDIINGNEDSFDKIDTRWDTSFTKWLQDMDNFVNSTDQMFKDLNSSGEEYQKQVDSLAEKVGQDFKDIGSTIDGCKDSTDALANATSDFISQLKADSETVSGYENTLLSYKARIAEVEQKSKEYYETMIALRQKLNDLYNKDSAASGPAGPAGGSSGSSGSGSGGDGGSSIDPSSYRAGDFIGYTGQYYNDSWGQSPVGNWYSGEQGAVRISSFSGEPYGDNSQTGEYSVHIETPDGGHLGWIRPDQMFDTGGYTGDWDNGITEAKNGKLAFLHQKELVLNETDTANILNAVNMIRAMTDGLKSGALSSALSNINSFSGMNSQSSQDLEQNIHIDANFPNVKDASEIEQAILSLADQATQYIHKIR